LKRALRPGSFQCAPIPLPPRQGTRPIYNNGPFITHPGQGFGGADASAVAVGLTTFGFGMNATEPVRLADNFTVAAGQIWNLTGVRFYGYQTGSTTTWSGADSVGSPPR
jgi:hypothetical protein